MVSSNRYIIYLTFQWQQLMKLTCEYYIRVNYSLTLSPQRGKIIKKQKNKWFQNGIFLYISSGESRHKGREKHVGNFVKVTKSFSERHPSATAIATVSHPSCPMNQKPTMFFSVFVA